MSDPAPETLEAFCPSKFVKGIPSEDLAVIAEFAGEFESQLRLLSQAGKSFAAPTGKDMLLVFKAAESELIDRFTVQVEPETVEPPDNGARVPPALDNDVDLATLPRTSDSEWILELGHEIPKPSDKDDDAEASDDDEPKKKKARGLKLPAILTPKEIQTMFDFAKSDERNGHRNYLILRVLYASGVRREELVNILVADLYPDRNIIFVRSGKADKDRYVLIDAETARLLTEYTRTFPLESPIFPLSLKTINRIVTGTAEESGVNKRLVAMGRNFTPHAFRHCFATHMYESGADLFLLKTLLGHLFLSVTKTYVHVGINVLSDGYQRHHPLALELPQFRPDRTRDLAQLDEDEQA